MTSALIIEVLSSTQGQHAGIASNFTVLHFADPEIDPPLGYFDGPLGGYLISDAGDVASMVNMFDDLREPALDMADSAELLAAILDEYRRKGGTAVRNSNHPDAGVVLFTRAEMDAYIKGVKAGEFDDLA